MHGIEKIKDLKINYLSFQHRKLEKEEQIKYKVSWRTNNNKSFGVESNKIKNKKSIEKINETKNKLFEKINKVSS